MHWLPAALLCLSTAMVFVSGAMLVGLKRPFAGFFAETLARPMLAIAGFAVAMTQLPGGQITALLGVLATAILVYGMAWLYGMTGSTNLVQIHNRVAQMTGQANDGLTLAILLLVAGLLFKIAAVPFHMWTPDAYQGAPTPVTAVTSVGPTAAGCAAAGTPRTGVTGSTTPSAPAATTAWAWRARWIQATSSSTCAA